MTWDESKMTDRQTSQRRQMLAEITRHSAEIGRIAADMHDADDGPIGQGRDRIGAALVAVCCLLAGAVLTLTMLSITGVL